MNLQRLSFSPGLILLKRMLWKGLARLSKRRTQKEFSGLCHCSTSLMSSVLTSWFPTSPLLALQQHGASTCRKTAESVSAFTGHGTKRWMLSKQPMTLLSLTQLFWLLESSYCRHGVLRSKCTTPQPAGHAAGDAWPASLLQVHPSIPPQGDGISGTTGGGSNHSLGAHSWGCRKLKTLP